MRKFTYKDVSNWEVVNIEGVRQSYTYVDKDGVKRTVSQFDGYRSGLQAANRMGGQLSVRRA